MAITVIFDDVDDPCLGAKWSQLAKGIASRSQGPSKRSPKFQLQSGILRLVATRKGKC